MPFVEEVTQVFQNIWAWFDSFTDIGDMFVQLFEGIGYFFTTVFNGIMGVLG
ncbi:MAG: hypothetical protein FWC27_03355 [Firmicutes bacterium]|nr:hypothetical protein [Bacillota bacterium]